MPDVLIRNVSKEVLDSLKKQAKRHNRSLQRELMVTLQEKSGDQIANIIAQADAIRERLLKSGRTFTDSVEIVRALRDARPQLATLMPITIGADIIEIDRIRQALARRPALASRLFTKRERAYCDQRADAAPHYAARFAAKEAVAKAVGQPLEWHQVEILNDARGRPLVMLHQQAAALAQVAEGGSVQISLSHSRDYALATALLQLPENTPDDEPSDVPGAGG